MDNQEGKQVNAKEMPAIKLAETIQATGKFVPPPPRGYVELLAREMECSTRAVTMALNGDALTYRAAMIRKRYMEKYVQPYL